MQMKSNLSRRKFLGNATLAAGAGLIGVPQTRAEVFQNKLPATGSHVNIGTISLMNLEAKSSPEMIKQVLDIMEEMVPSKPDIICLPEVFAFTFITDTKYTVKEVAENAPGPVTSQFAKFAAAHNCYIICPTYTRSEGNIYISAVLIDRQGKIVGEYHKMRPTVSEMELGIKPGKLDPPVFETDFGKIGIQICFDVKYEQGWQALKEKGAQIIFWPSAYASGREISSRAWKHQVYIVTSTLKDTSKICDFDGEAIAQTSRWQRNWVCAPVNLEKAFIHAWPAATMSSEIQKKYGNRIALQTYGEEEWMIIESRDNNLKIADVLKEFKLQTMHDMLNEMGAAQDAKRT
jgi:beta-ureidopropionase